MKATTASIITALAAVLLFLIFFFVTVVKADELPDWKNIKFQVIEKDDNALVAMSEPHQDTKDIKSVYLMIVYAELSSMGTRALLSHEEVNCTLSRIKWSVAYRLGENGELLGTLAPHTPDWQQINLNSPSADLYELVCGHPVTPSQEANI